MGLSLIPCSKKDFMKGNFDKIIINMIYEKEKAKLSRFDLASKNEFIFSDYYLKFNKNTHVCGYCNMEPATKKTKSSETDKNICSKCDDYIELGEQLTKATHINIFHDDNGIFNRYIYDYNSNNISNAIHRMYIDLHSENSEDYNCCNVIHYKSHVVRDNNNNICSFEQIANSGIGADILAVYKADVDNLGLVFSCGLSKKDSNYNVIESKITFSKINMLSRLVHNFFSYYLSYLMDKEKLNVYTVFAGGDDLFIVGKYTDIIKLSELIYNEFTKFTGENKELSISAGIELFKDGSIWYVAEKAEERLSRAKNYRVNNDNDIYKGNMDILYSTNKYDDFIFQYNEFNKIISIVNEDISKNFYYKLLEFCEMEEHYKKSINNIENLMWRPRLYNSIVSLKLSQEQNEQILTYFTKYIGEYPTLIKTMIALKLYDLRNKNN